MMTKERLRELEHGHLSSCVLCKAALKELVQEVRDLQKDIEERKAEVLSRRARTKGDGNYQ